MLPISTPPAPTDVAVCGWAGITIRVAWELLACGARVKPQSLRDARDHVLLHLSPTTPIAHAEDRAATLTRDFVSRARQSPVKGYWTQDGAMPLSPRWRRALEQSLTPLSEAILRYHYADGHSLAQLERMVRVDLVSLEASRGGLREVVRQAACDDGLPMETWPIERVDALLQRLAAFSLGPCPPLHEVLEGLHDAHIRRCARCDRASRLLRGGVISTADLVPPKLGARPTQMVEVLAVHFHPDGRKHRATMVAEADVPLFPVDEDLLLLDAEREDEVRQLLILATEVASPPRELLRVARLEGQGRWSQHGLLGPLAQQARDIVRSRAWGTVDGMGELPNPLPEPPTSRPLWFGAAGAAAIAAAALAFWIQPSVPIDDSDVLFTPGRGGVWTAFDVDEEDRVLLVREINGELELVHASASAADKALWATGDGGYRVHAMGEGVLLASTQRDWPDLQALLTEASATSTPLDTVARRLTIDLDADVHTWKL
ncbi:MAG: hypothetical protein KC912_26605 [Proteobacteria bacterium]|nr:hypothetical protein [Pseudomonadota bacterium]